MPDRLERDRILTLVAPLIKRRERSLALAESAVQKGQELADKLLEDEAKRIRKEYERVDREKKKEEIKRDIQSLFKTKAKFGWGGAEARRKVDGEIVALSKKLAELFGESQ